MVAQNLTLRVTLDAAEAERIIVRFLKDTFAGARARRTVVGLSGGIDSAVAAALAVRALGASHVLGLILPTRTSPQEDLEDAALVADHLGIKTRTIDVEPLLAAFESVAEPADAAQRGNAAARLRMVLLHHHAHRRKALVLGTGNKSELLTGYFSKFGDGGVDVQPIGDLYKTQVRALASHMGIPRRVQAKAPSARLWEGQTDEAELGLPYDILDRILLGLEVRLTPDRIAQAVGVAEAEVARVAALRQATQHKRRTPMAPKFGLRTPGIDWRSATTR